MIDPRPARLVAAVFRALAFTQLLLVDPVGLGFGVAGPSLLGGCSRAGNTERADARVLEDVLAADHALEAALREADALARNDEKKAAALLESRAIPLARDVVARANAARVASAWGADRKAELSSLATDRERELPRYALALRDGDLKTKLEALEAQLALQKRALDAASKISQVPP